MLWQELTQSHWHYVVEYLNIKLLNVYAIILHNTFNQY